MDEETMKVFIIGAIEDEKHLGENLKKQCKEFIENLIMKNKELEEENEKLKYKLKQETSRRINVELENEDICNEVNKNYIKKNCVKEMLKKLEEYNYKGNLDDIDFINKTINEFQEFLDS